MTPANFLSLACLLLTSLLSHALPVPSTLQDFQLPGSQPGQSGTLMSPAICDNCHSGYGEPEVEPFHNWRGSMMGQAMRDPL
ncbi:MAG: hypothetical protein KC488_01215, partial [Candidatus Cloacimonetes bacterium]|nr:hypothetical protein [Candidatus Cloacimonadota bacterium]